MAQVVALLMLGVPLVSASAAPVDTRPLVAPMMAPGIANGPAMSVVLNQARVVVGHPVTGKITNVDSTVAPYVELVDPAGVGVDTCTTSPVDATTLKVSCPTKASYEHGTYTVHAVTLDASEDVSAQVDLIGALTATDVVQFSPIVVDGEGWPAGGAVTVTAVGPDGSKVTRDVVTDTAGAFEVEFATDASTPPGVWTISATDGVSTSTTAAQVSAFTQAPALMLSKDTLDTTTEGAQVVRLSGVLPDSEVTLLLVAPDGTLYDMRTVTTQAPDGSATASLWVPFGSPTGGYAVQAVSATGEVLTAGLFTVMASTPIPTDDPTPPPTGNPTPTDNPTPVPTDNPTPVPSPTAPASPSSSATIAAVDPGEDVLRNNFVAGTTAIAGTDVTVDEETKPRPDATDDPSASPTDEPSADPSPDVKVPTVREALSKGLQMLAWLAAAAVVFLGGVLLVARRRRDEEDTEELYDSADSSDTSTVEPAEVDAPAGAAAKPRSSYPPGPGSA